MEPAVLVLLAKMAGPYSIHAKMAVLDLLVLVRVLDDLATIQNGVVYRLIVIE